MSDRAVPDVSDDLLPLALRRSLLLIAETAAAQLARTVTRETFAPAALFEVDPEGWVGQVTRALCLRFAQMNTEIPPDLWQRAGPQLLLATVYSIYQALLVQACEDLRLVRAQLAAQAPRGGGPSARGDD